MAIHVYVCPRGHVEEKQESANTVSKIKCKYCGVAMVLGVGRTGHPVLKRGVGGFDKPSD